MLRRAVPFVPVVVLLAALVWGVDGALSAICAIAIVLVNLALSAAMLSWAAERSPAALMGAALGGFLVRMLLVTGAVWGLKSQSWIELVPLAITVLVTHLGL